MTEISTVPDGYHTVTPWFSSRDCAALIDFIVEVFDATELGRMEMGGRIGHAEVRIADSVVMMFDANPDWPDIPTLLRLYIADDAGTIARAAQRGATVVTEPTEVFWGDRVSRIRDPFGNLWWLHQRVADVDEAEAARRADQPEYQQAMAYVMSADPFGTSSGKT